MYKQNITYNDVPEVLAILLDKLQQLDTKVNLLVSANDGQDEPIWFNVPELINYLPTHPAEQTIYSWTSSNKIPFHKKGRRILFNKKEIDKWLQENEHHKSESDLEEEAVEFIKSKHKRSIQ